LAKASLTCSEWRDRPIYWSTIAYLRAWWSSDGVRVSQIKKLQRMTPKMLRSLGREYNVNRSIIRKDKKRGAPDENAEAICAILECEQALWPTEMLSRMAACVCLVAKLRPYTLDGDTDLASAATKFMWFLRPDEWTVYDRFAAAGIRVPSKFSDAIERMPEFYRLLNEADFVPLVHAMQPVIDETSLRGLPATRILDTLLMARGGSGGDEDAVQRLQMFLALLPVATQTPVIDLANALQSQFATHRLTHADRPPIRRMKKARA
jgi:hypothetical protein